MTPTGRLLLRLSLLCLLIWETATIQVKENKQLLEHRSVQELKLGPRKSDTLVGKYLNGKGKKQSQSLQQVPDPHEDNSECQVHCIKCNSIIDCVQCEQGFVLIEGQCLEEIIDPDEMPSPDTTPKSQPIKKTYSWIIWLVIIVVLAGGAFFLVYRCRANRDPEQYQNHNNPEHRMFEMTKKESPRQGTTIGLPKPGIMVHKPMEDTERHQATQGHNVLTSELIDRKQFTNSPAGPKSDSHNSKNPLGLSNPRSPLAPGFDSFIPGNSPQPLKAIGLPVQEVNQVFQSDLISQRGEGGSFNMMKKVQPTELKPRTPAQIAEFDPLVESVILDQKQSPSKTRSPHGTDKLEHSGDKMEHDHEVVTSQFFASTLPSAPKK